MIILVARHVATYLQWYERVMWYVRQSSTIGARAAGAYIRPTAHVINLQTNDRNQKPTGTLLTFLQSCNPASSHYLRELVAYTLKTC